MSQSQIIVTFAGLLAIALIVWWFWLSSPKATHIEGQAPVDITVKNGAYQPAVIEVLAGEAVTLRFLREDASPCAEKVVFGDLGITENLPLKRPHTFRLAPLPSGLHEFTCQMGMYRGKLIARV